MKVRTVVATAVATLVLLTGCSAQPANGTDPKVDWVRSVIAEAGLKADFPIEVTDDEVCSSAIAVGCTYIDDSIGKPVDMKIKANLIGTDVGKFVVLHEMGHVAGIVDECAADDYSHAHGGSAKWQAGNCHR